MGSMGDGVQRSGLHHLPFRIRESTYQTRSSPKDGVVAAPGGDKGGHTNTTIRKRFPDSLSLLGSDTRLRSPTESSMSSVPDSATSYSHSTVASPLSSSYTSDLQDFMCSSTSSRPHSRVRHRHQPSTGTCSTFVNDDDDGALVVPGYYGSKVRDLPETIMVLPQPMGMDTDDETAPVSPMTEGPDDDEEALQRKLKRFSNCTAKDLKLEPDVAPEAPEQDQDQDQWDTSSTVSNENCSAEDVDLILDYTLQLAYGVDINDTTVKRPESRQLVQRFIQELGQSIWQNGPESQRNHGNGQNSNNNNAMSTSASSSSTPAGSTGDSQRGGKRKKASTGRPGGDEEADDFSDGEGNGGNGGGDGYQAVKRPKPNPREDDNLRLSCPFRKRNPHRFNVRDHHSCSLTYFPKFSELRQHIVKQHKRDDPSAFVCDRCNRDFTTRKELRDHQRLPKEQICDIANFDPENGVDGPTANKLLSRKRASGSSPEVQWREIWNILFPDDDDHVIQNYYFTPVIEHFELSSNYTAAFHLLKTSLCDKMSNPATLETLATKFQQCFVETVERCIADAQSMPYANRSNKRNEQPTTVDASRVLARKVKQVLPRPDSGVVIDDGSEESGSVMGSGPMQSSYDMGGGMTVYSSRRASNLAPAPLRDSSYASRTSSAIYEEQPLGQQQHQQQQHQLQQLPQQPPAMTSAAMSALPMTASTSLNPVDIQAWTNGLMYPTDGADTGVPDFFDPTVGDPTAMHHDLAAWSQQFYHTGDAGVGNDYPFHQTR